jgi:hypothetical protein
MARRIAVAAGGRVVGTTADGKGASNNAAFVIFQAQYAFKITIGWQ